MSLQSGDFQAETTAHKESHDHHVDPGHLHLCSYLVHGYSFLYRSAVLLSHLRSLCALYLAPWDRSFRRDALDL
ncbi:hypothetical protein L596_012317 [Steinernema carpocapsae]|uniref:Uncharacterized protein n=1 Tax=Steinernema carpocapsae TaxID=34508 RepID=A0A4V6A4R6_STECR|nr:hypothetical protein L596_012317 [Steinernema carpocapsae]